MESALELIAEQTGGSEHTIYELFKWSLLLKGAISLAEAIVGTGLLLVPWPIVAQFAAWLRVHASNGADSALMSHVLKELGDFTRATVTFVALYLLIRGVLKLGLIWQLLRNRLWAYPASLFIMGCFVLYQLYQIWTGGSLLVVALTVFDIIVLGLIWHEWRITLRYRTRM